MVRTEEENKRFSKWIEGTVPKLDTFLETLLVEQADICTLLQVYIARKAIGVGMPLSSLQETVQMAYISEVYRQMAKREANANPSA